MSGEYIVFVFSLINNYYGTPDGGAGIHKGTSYRFRYEYRYNLILVLGPDGFWRRYVGENIRKRITKKEIREIDWVGFKQFNTSLFKEWPKWDYFYPQILVHWNEDSWLEQLIKENMRPTFLKFRYLYRI
jgi:hypothetical protein